MRQWQTFEALRTTCLSCFKFVQADGRTTPDLDGECEQASDGSLIEINHACLTDPKYYSAEGGSGGSAGLWR